MFTRLALLLAVAAAALWPGTPAHAAVIIRCESIDYEQNFCHANTHAGVRLHRQISDSACTLGHSWGYDRNGIWVGAGCAAEFEIGAHGQGYGYGYGYNQGGYVHCESHDYQRGHCAVNTGGSVRIVNQTSHSACIEGQTWGWDHGGIWVSHGCAGEFQVGSGHGGGYGGGHSGGAYQGSSDHDPEAYSGGGYGGAGHGNREVIRCESHDNVRNFCDARHNRRIRLLRQLSSAHCIEGNTWYATDRGVFVDHGCRADFEVTY
jgi:hypothetical protein